MNATPLPLSDPAPDAAFDPTPDPTAGPDTGSTRRTFMAGAGAAGVLGAAAVTAVATAGPAAASSRPGSDAPPASGDAVVAYVRDPVRGEVRLLSGEREVVVHDPELARTLAGHAAREER